MQAEVTAKTGDAKEGKVEIPEKKKTDNEHPDKDGSNSLRATIITGST